MRIITFAQGRRPRWDFNERVHRDKLKEVKAEFESKRNSSSKIEVRDLHDINPDTYKTPEQDYRVRYKL